MLENDFYQLARAISCDLQTLKSQLNSLKLPDVLEADLSKYEDKLTLLELRVAQPLATLASYKPNTNYCKFDFSSIGTQLAEIRILYDKWNTFVRLYKKGKVLEQMESDLDNLCAIWDYQKRMGMTIFDEQERILAIQRSVKPKLQADEDIVEYMKKLEMKEMKVESNFITMIKNISLVSEIEVKGEDWDDLSCDGEKL